MLKHIDIINQMSDSDKINILCNISSLSDKKYRIFGVPRIKVSSLEELCGKKYPSPVALANTWDTDLISGISNSIFREAAENDVNMVMLPGPKMRINPYRFALTEDSFLSGSLIRKYTEASEKENISVAFDNCFLHNDEVEWLDESPDKRFISEYVTLPLLDTLSNVNKGVLFSKADIQEANYEKINTDINKQIASNLHDGIFSVYKKMSDEKTVQYLNEGVLFFEGSSIAVEVALARYKQLKKEIEQAVSSADDLNYEISQGRATTPEILDSAVDKLLELAFAIKRRSAVTDTYGQDDLGYKAVCESTVLLKNERNILPIKKSSSVCIIGDIAAMNDGSDKTVADELGQRLTEEGYVYNGFSRGYKLFADRTPDMLPEAIELAKRSDVVFLFLGLGEKDRKRTVKDCKLAIPANQQELLDDLGQTSARIVAILPPEGSPDICMPEKCSAILLAPISTAYSACAICDILTGKACPSGKLASTLYYKTEELYSKHVTHKKRDKLKSGSFIGYRYYDIANDAPEFPFGYGLSYTTFDYSDIRVNNQTVSFKVTNRGSVSGAEVAQAYIGKNMSSILRPKKELCGFARVELRAGESKRVEISINIPKVYDEKADSYVIENGEYTVSVGASVIDIRLEHKLNISGDRIEPEGKKLSDYVHTVSNIKSDNFKLEAKYKKMKKAVFNYISGALALILAAVLKVYCAYKNISSVFIDLFCIGLGLVGISYLVMGLISRSAAHKEERKKVEELSKKEFADADTIPVYSADKMFVKEFDTSEEEEVKVEEEKTEGVDAELLAYIDKEQTFEKAARDFETFAEDRGYRFDAETVRNIFAALASSRLIVVSGMDSNSYKNLIMLLSSYFNSAAYIDRIDSTYKSPDRILFCDDAAGNRRVATNAFKAVESGRNIKHSVHFAALDNVIAANVHEYFAPYVSYAKNPLANCHVTVRNERYVESTYYIPQNLWFIMNLANGETPDKLPDFMTEVAVSLKISYKEVKAADEPKTVKRFTYYQMGYLTDRVISKTSVPEEVWKKIDRLEEQVRAKAASFTLGNRMWLSLEKYAYVYIACGGEVNDALDRATCGKLMAAIVSALKKSESGFDRGFVETVEAIFGDGNAYACQRFINDCGSV